MRPALQAAVGVRLVPAGDEVLHLGEQRAVHRRPAGRRGARIRQVHEGQVVQDLGLPDVGRAGAGTGTDDVGAANAISGAATAESISAWVKLRPGGAGDAGVGEGDGDGTGDGEVLGDGEVVGGWDDAVPLLVHVNVGGEVLLPL